MSDIKTAMKLIGGVEPTPQQVQRVQAIAHSLGFQANDPMMGILIALDVYHGAFNALPAKAQSAAAAVFSGVEKQHEANMQQIAARTVENMAPAYGKALKQVAGDVAGRDKVKMFTLAAIISMSCLGLFGWLTHMTGYSSGFDGGKAEGYKTAMDEKAAAAWANTPQGVLAFELAQAGNLESLAYCSGKGWKLKEGACSPMPVTEGEVTMVYGWQVGKSAVGNPVRRTNLSWWEHLTGMGQS